MRHCGDSNEYNELRNREVMQAYKTIMANYGGRVSTMTIYEMVAFSPASRFFISPGRAYRMMREYGKQEKQFDSRARMYQEIHKRVTALIEEQPELSLPQAVEIVIKQPAPELYLSISQIMHIIGKEKKKEGEERARKFKERCNRLGFCITNMNPNHGKKM